MVKEAGRLTADFYCFLAPPWIPISHSHPEFSSKIFFGLSFLSASPPGDKRRDYLQYSSPPLIPLAQPPASADIPWKATNHISQKGKQASQLGRGVSGVNSSSSSPSQIPQAYAQPPSKVPVRPFVILYSNLPGVKQVLVEFLAFFPCSLLNGSQKSSSTGSTQLSHSSKNQKGQQTTKK